MNAHQLHSYRCTYIPKAATFESGVTRDIQVKAFDSIDAMHRAHLITGRQIIEAARFEPL